MKLGSLLPVGRSFGCECMVKTLKLSPHSAQHIMRTVSSLDTVFWKGHWEAAEDPEESAQVGTLSGKNGLNSMDY